MSVKVAAIICAAGASTRFGGARKKPFVDVEGRAAFLRSVELFADNSDIKQIILAISKEDDEIVKIKWGANLSFHGVKLCYGGAERYETVANALKLIREDIDLVAIHDGARPCLTKDWLEAVIKEATRTEAAIHAAPVVATLKKVENKIITGTVDRTNIYEAQTPQIFSAVLLRKAYANLENLDKKKISDDAQLVEALGHKVSIVETDFSNIKITTKADVAIAEAIIKSRPKPKLGYANPFEEAQW
ncbi:MAG: 2-C-methyl-D-erythritol 4-phosphate cytidylyltransferase [Planctomycetes bacterium GWF2_50_10]|nr:MAG: 2-C-methyl-D-erythritol 4-phosphate cytidylyltransferase [Planctomycetes bacterium GWF2_50_10]